MCKSPLWGNNRRPENARALGSRLENWGNGYFSNTIQCLLPISSVMYAALIKSIQVCVYWIRTRVHFLSLASYAAALMQLVGLVFWKVLFNHLLSFCSSFSPSLHHVLYTSSPGMRLLSTIHVHRPGLHPGLCFTDLWISHHFFIVLLQEKVIDFGAVKLSCYLGGKTKPVLGEYWPALQLMWYGKFSAV